MRIGIDARFYGGEQSKGLGRYTQKLIEQLAEHDHSNEYVIFLQEESFKEWKITNANFTPVLAPYRWYTLAEQIFLPWKIWRAKVDFMHFPHFNVPLLHRKPFLVTIHDLIIIHFPTERATTLGPLLYKIKHWAGKRVMRHAVKNSSKIITVSNFSKQDIADYYQVAPEKIVVTYEATDAADEISTAQDEVAVLQSYKIEKPYLLYVGNAYPHKNLEILLQMMKEIKNKAEETPWKLVLVGKEDYFYARIKQQAWSMNLEENVIFTGFVPDDELPALYKNALLYIFPSLYEGFGLPPLEAMAHGTPVLAAQSSCLEEILGEAAIYFHPEDVSGIINASKKIQQDRSLRNDYIEKGFAKLKQYSWEKMMQQTLQLYEQFATKQKEASKKETSS